MNMKSIEFPQKRVYDCRDDEIRATLSLEECVRRIKKVYKSEYVSDNINFDAWDQLLACEAVDESTPLTEGNPIQEKTNVNVNGMNNGGCKHNVNFELTPNKLDVITELKTHTYKTDPIKIAQLLTEFFKEWPSKDSHWLYIAQSYPPRRIVFTLSDIIKRHKSGHITLKNPAAYFTHIIQFRKKRKHH